MAYIGKQPAVAALTSSDLEDGIVTSAKILDGTIATADISDGAVTSIKTTGVGGANTPAFRANVDDQSGFTTSWKKVEFDTEVFDTDGCYDNTTNYRFTPTSTGKYLLTFMIYFNGSASNSYQIGRIYKNGSADTYAQISISVGSGGFDNGVSGSVIVEANGTTDYFEIYAFGGSGTRDIYRGSFSGFKIIE